jgi:ABC-type uncharacterized transport system permease subunit
MILTTPYSSVALLAGASAGASAAASAASSAAPVAASVAWPWALPAAVALGLYVAVAAVAWGAPPWRRAVLWAAWALHAVAIVLDVSAWGQAAPGGLGGARFGFAPALSVTWWMVLLVYIVESRHWPSFGVQRAVALVGAVTVLLAWVFPGELKPLALSPWAPLHWGLGMAAYGLLGAAVLHAVLLGRADRQFRLKRAQAESGPSILMLERLTFRFVAAGFVALTAALLLGVLHAPAWSWNHKVLLSVLAWVVFALLLLGRWRLGWRGRQATRWLYAGAGLLLLAYVGSRFVLEVLLQRASAGA